MLRMTRTTSSLCIGMLSRARAAATGWTISQLPSRVGIRPMRGRVSDLTEAALGHTPGPSKMERIPGEPFSEHRSRLSIEEKCCVASQLAGRVRAVHEAPTAGPASFRNRPGEWMRLIQARAVGGLLLAQRAAVPEGTGADVLRGEPAPSDRGFPALLDERGSQRLEHPGCGAGRRVARHRTRRPRVRGGRSGRVRVGVPLPERARGRRAARSGVSCRLRLPPAGAARREAAPEALHPLLPGTRRKGRLWRLSSTRSGRSNDFLGIPEDAE